MENVAYIILGLVVLQRISELFLSNRNTKRLLATGSMEFYPGHYFLIVGLHTFWLIALIISVAPQTSINIYLFIIFLVLQFARYYVISTLGKYWTTRIIRNPQTPLVTTGIYKFIKHPNYLIVAIEIYLLPMVFGMPELSLIFGTLNLAILVIRIYYENEALNKIS